MDSRSAGNDRVHDASLSNKMDHNSDDSQWYDNFGDSDDREPD